ncbi:MAG: hypothetical protein ACI9E5_000958 [Candidatus Omnitrophota bacterium]|jgi:hypothetical protein
MKKYLSLFLILILSITFLPTYTCAQPTPSMFDDEMHLKGFVDKYKDVPKEILLEMIKDDTLTNFKTAAAVNVFKNTFSEQSVSKEKRRVERILIRSLKDTTSPFVQVEIMGTLIRIDRYKYFKPMVPKLISKLNHYNSVVNKLAFDNLDYSIKTGDDRPREARIAFNTLRKMFFLMRNRLTDMDPTENPQLSYKLSLLRWSIKVLGNDHLKKLPNEVLNLL